MARSRVAISTNDPEPFLNRTVAEAMPEFFKGHTNKPKEP